MHVAVMVLMPFHRIGAMVGELGIKPPMQGCNLLRVGCSIGKFGATVDLSIVDGNLPGFG